jgi:hypothetical protein
MTARAARMSSATAAALEAAYPTKSNPDLAAQFNLSLRSVEMFGYRHGLKKIPVVRQQGRLVARQLRRSEELRRRDAFILVHFRDMTAVQMAEALSWCPHRVRDRCQALGVEFIRAPKGPAPAGAAPRKAPEQIVVPAGVVVQRAPSIRLDPRYQCDPAMPVPQVFRVVPIGCDPMTGKAWEARP